MAWSQRLAGPYHPTPLVYGDYLYVLYDRGQISCFEAKTGAVKWQHRSVGRGSLVAADGHLYLRNEQGVVALVEATPEGYREKGRFKQPERSKIADPAQVERALELRISPVCALWGRAGLRS